MIQRERGFVFALVHTPGALTRLLARGTLLAAWSSLLVSAAFAQLPSRLPPVDQPMRYQPGEMGGRMVQPFALPGQTSPGQWSGAAATQRSIPELVAEREEQNQAIMLDEYYPPPADEGILMDDGTVVVTPNDKPKEGKDGFIQEIAIIGSWLPQLEGDSLGLSEASISMTGGLPFPTRNFPLLITPFFQTMFLDGPVTPDLPPRVYSTYLQFRWLPKITDHWRLDVGASPGMYSDFQIDDGQAFRLTGRGIVIYTFSEKLMLAGGVLYRPARHQHFAGGGRDLGPQRRLEIRTDLSPAEDRQADEPLSRYV